MLQIVTRFQLLKKQRRSPLKGRAFFSFQILNKKSVNVAVAVVITVIMVTAFAVFMVVIMIMAVAMTVRAVRVAVLDFFFGCVTNIEDFDREKERLACERVIAIEMNLIAVDLFDRENHSHAIAACGFKGHAFFELNAFWELSALDGHLEGWVDLAVAILRGNGDVFLVADLKACERALETWNDLLRAMKIAERILCVGFIQNLTCRVFETILEIYNFAVLNVHNFRPFYFSCLVWITDSSPRTWSL